MSVQQFLFEGIGEAFDFFVGLTIQVTDDGDRIRAAQLAFLETLLASSDGIASADQIVRDPDVAYDDGGKKIGPAIRELQDDGLIRFVRAKRSTRRSRNGGLTGVWQLTDRNAAKAKARRLRLGLSFLLNDGSAGATAEPSVTNPKLNEESSNG